MEKKLMKLFLFLRISRLGFTRLCYSDPHQLRLYRRTRGLLPSLKADGGDVEFVGSFGLIHYTHRTLHHPARRQQGDKPPTSPLPHKPYTSSFYPLKGRADPPRCIYQPPSGLQPGSSRV